MLKATLLIFDWNNYNLNNIWFSYLHNSDSIYLFVFLKEKKLLLASLLDQFNKVCSVNIEGLYFSE